MTTTLARKHSVNGDLLEKRIQVAIAGVGGNGAQVVGLLARLHLAVLALGHPLGLHITAYDPDSVSEANVGRQLWSPSDVGENKAIVAIHRCNQFYGLDWDAVPARYEGARCDILVSCVDTRKARRGFARHIEGGAGPSYYWLDMGNEQHIAQCCLGEIPCSYQRRNPCVFGFSGKDSAMVAALTFEAARRHVAGGRRARVLALTADTGIENPGVVAVRQLEYERMRCFAAENGIDFEGHVSTPTLLNSWAVRILSGRALPSFHNSHRDCSIDWKQFPLRALRNSLLSRLKKEGAPAVVLLGTRLDESATRQQGMRERNETWGTPWVGADGHLYMSPIAPLSADDVWEFHGLCSSGLFKTFSDFSELRTLYADSGGSSCSIVGAMSTEDVKLSRPCSARQGCILCLAIGERDRSLEAMIETNPAYMPLEPVRRLRQFLYATRYDWLRRNWLGRTIDPKGYITIAPDAYGPAMLQELGRMVWSIDANERERAWRAGTPPLFQLCPLEAVIAIDALQDLNGLAKPFSALRDFLAIQAGQRYQVPVVDEVPATPLPTKRYLFVGDDWDANTRCFGLRDYLLESFDGCGFEPVALNNGRIITDFQTSDTFSVDLEGALDFIQFEAAEMIARYGDGSRPTVGLRLQRQGPGHRRRVLGSRSPQPCGEAVSCRPRTACRGYGGPGVKAMIPASNERRQQAVRIFKIAGPVLEGKYQGTGYAIGAIAKGQLIDFRYLSEVLDLSGDEGPEEIMQYLADARLGPTVRYMQALGEVSVGMCSCYEFVEL